MTPAERYEELWRELALADDVGFTSAFTVEHHFSPHESWMPSPPVYCTSAAARTRNLRVGPMGYIVPLYDPLRIVEDAAVLDQVLDGRLELGLVSGITPHYFGPYGADFTNRRQLANEAIQLVKAAFAKDDGPFSFEGQFHKYEEVELSVRPVQRPHPPLWLQSRDPETLSFLAAEGVHTGYLLLMPRDATAPRYRQYLSEWRAAGHRRRPNIAYWTLVHVAETDEAAIEAATPNIQMTFGEIGGFGDVGGTGLGALADNLRKRGEFAAAEIADRLTDVQYLLDRNLVFVGSPDTVVRRIREASEEGLFNTLLGEFNMGGLPEDHVLRSIQLFGEEVIPALREYEPY